MKQISELLQTHKIMKNITMPVDTKKFKELGSRELLDTLGITIKHDEENKLATFLCQLTAYTDNAQFNISFNAPSSTGKSFIPTEIAKLFPEEDVMELAYASPTSFFHMNGEYDKEKGHHLLDFSRKILIFLDQPHMDLLARLRPMLSHDKKEIMLKITDKNQKSSLRTKTVIMRGYPSVIFCTAGLRIDEQEATRFLLLSPEVSQEKIREGILATIMKESNSENYKNWLNSNPDRLLLKERLQAIKDEQITEINISEEDCVKIRERFLGSDKKLKPKHQRDIKRLLALAKAFALLNSWFRERKGSIITASHHDIEESFKLWDKISVSQELNLPPYIYNLYNEVILALWDEKNTNRDEFEEVTGPIGITRQEVLEKHYLVYGRMLDNAQLRLQILPMLETAGLIRQEQDISDRRKILIYPTLLKQIVRAPKEYSNTEGGVEIEQEINNLIPSGATN